MREMGLSALSKEHKPSCNRIRVCPIFVSFIVYLIILPYLIVMNAQRDKHAPWQNINKISYARMLSSFCIVSYPDFPHPNIQSTAKVPFLRWFASDWETAEIVRIQLKNRH